MSTILRNPPLLQPTPEQDPSTARIAALLAELVLAFANEGLEVDLEALFGPNEADEEKN